MGSNVFSGIENKFPSSYYITPTKAEKERYSKQEKKEKFINTAKAVAPIVIPLVTIPLTAGITYKLATKKVSSLNNRVNELEEAIKTMSENNAKQIEEAVKKASNSGQKFDAKIWAVLLSLAGLGTKFNIEKFSDEDKDVVANTAANRVKNIESRVGKAEYNSSIAMQSSGVALSSKYLDSEYSQGINLLTSDTSTRNNSKYKKAIDTIKNTARKYSLQPPIINKLTKNSTIWSITSEYAPIKEGGLGSVPVEIQENAAKLGVNIPTFVPMYQQRHLATFKQEGDECIYKYKDKKFKLKKAASFQVDTFHNGKSKIENVEIFVPVIDTNDVELSELLKRKQLVFIKNDTYFNGPIYSPSIKTEEAEKFAFFSKAVYELAKGKLDEDSLKGLNIFDRSLFDSILPPDAFVLNDWQASPIAALSRYKSQLENAHGQLSDSAADKLSNINIITIGHNTVYQGSTRNNNNEEQRQQATTNILNTLFDEFASDIVRNASSGAVDTDPEDKNLENIDNVLLLNQKDSHANHTNLLNMGVALSNYFVPVSKNYAKEITTQPDMSGELMWLLTQRAKYGSLVGIINGNDYNKLSIEAKKTEIKKKTKLDFETYNRNDSVQEIVSARENNKSNFYNNYIVPLSKSKCVDNLEFVDSVNNSILEVLSPDELSQTPVISSVGRLVSQKGINIMCEAIKLLFDNWEKDFPNKNKPIFYIAGKDGEGGTQRAYIQELKNNKLSENDSKRVIFMHGFAPMTGIAAASDFFLLPSKFEPCGLTQGESFAVGTPVIASAVGGIVDTVNRNNKSNGILTPYNEPLTAENFYKAIKDALEIYFNNQDVYKKMVFDSITEDFSWIQDDKQGSVYDYLEKLGIDRKELP